MDATEEQKRHRPVLECIKMEMAKDDSLQLVQHYIRSGWPQHERNVTRPVRDYYRERASLSEQNGLTKRPNQIVIPQTLRSEMLERIHHGHLGLKKC